MNTTNVAFNKKTNQISVILFTTTYENSHALVHKCARGTNPTWADTDVMFLNITQVEKLLDIEENWGDPSEDTLKKIGLK